MAGYGEAPVDDIPLELFELRLAGAPIEELESALEFYEGLPSQDVDLTGVSYDDPRDFFWHVLGCRPTEAAKSHGLTKPWSDDIEALMLSVWKNKRTVVYSGNSTGKTWCVARLVLWFLFRYPLSRVVTTAPNKRQVEDLLWGEIRSAFKAAGKELPGRLLNVKLQVADLWDATGFTARIAASDTTASGFQGVHGPFILVVLDEAAGIHAQIIEAAGRCAVGVNDRIIAAGNPTDSTSKYAQLASYRRAPDPRDKEHPQGRPLWNKIVISSANHPNVIYDDPAIVPGAATRDFLDARLAETGSEDSAIYRSSVLGLFPTEVKDALIQLGWITRAQVRSGQMDDDKVAGKFESMRRGIALGLDVAGMGDDLTICLAFEDDRLFMPKLKEGEWAWHRGRDPMHAVALIERICKVYPDVRAVALDDTGLGQGVTGRLRELQKAKRLPSFTIIKRDQLQTHPILLLPTVLNATPLLPKRFVLRKDELWWGLREALRERKTLCLPTTAEMATWGLPRGVSLVAQLSNPIYDADNRGRIAVYDKRGAHGKEEKTKHLPALSPDVAHAAILANEAYRRLPTIERVLPRTVEEAFQDRLKNMVKGSNTNTKVQRGLPSYMLKR